MKTKFQCRVTFRLAGTKMSYKWVLHLVLVGCMGFQPVLAGEHSLTTVEPKLIYKNHCSVCHGDRGDGRSRASNSLIPPPRNFTTAFDLTRERMIATVTYGKPGTAMAAWQTQLSEQQIGGVVDYVRATFMQPALEAHLTYGRLVYGHNCKSCHGDQGQGVVTENMAVAPRSFSVRGAKTRLTREQMIAAVTRGVPGTVMWGYDGKLSAEHIAAVADYVRETLMVDDATPSPDTGQAAQAPVDMSLPMPKGLRGNARLGGQFFSTTCADCHGAKGDGEGPRAYFITPRPRNFLEDYARARLNRPAIFTAVTHGLPGTPMPAWGKVLTEQEIANVTEFVFKTFIQPGK